MQKQKQKKKQLYSYMHSKFYLQSKFTYVMLDSYRETNKKYTQNTPKKGTCTESCNAKKKNNNNKKKTVSYMHSKLFA